MNDNTEEKISALRWQIEILDFQFCKSGNGEEKERILNLLDKLSSELNQLEQVLCSENEKNLSLEEPERRLFKNTFERKESPIKEREDNYGKRIRTIFGEKGLSVDFKSMEGAPKEINNKTIGYGWWKN